MAKFKDICTKIGSGATPRGGKEAYCEEGISLIRSQNVLDFAFSTGGLVYINELQAEKLKNVIVEEDDILLNITGDSVARACIVDKKYLPARVNQHVCIIRADSSKAIPSYLLYYLQLNKEYLLQLASGGATRNALTKDMVNNLELELPTVEEQQKIVTVLNDIQKKIDCNNAVNENFSGLKVNAGDIKFTRHEFRKKYIPKSCKSVAFFLIRDNSISYRRNKSIKAI